MGSYWIGAAALMSAYTVYSLVSSVIESRRRAQNAAKWGCKPPLTRPQIYPFGIDLLQRVLKASDEKRIPYLFMAIYEEMGRATTWKQHMIGNETLITMDPKNIQAVLATQFNEFSLGSVRRGNFFPLLGNGIFIQDGRGWEHSRAMLRPQFAREQVADLELEEAHVQNLLRHLPTDSSGWTAQVDLQVLFYNLTLDSATEFLFGESVDIQLASLPEPPDLPAKKDASGNVLDWSTFAEDWDYCTDIMGRRARLGDKFWLHSPRRWYRACKRIHQFADYYVNLALTTDFSSLKRKSAEGHHDRQKYVFLQELASKTQDPVELRSQLLNILLAGRDTTAGLLGWTFHTLVRHPSVYAQLRSVILDSFGSFDSPHDITFSNLKSCTYLQHVLHEILRLYPSVPFNSRRCLRDTTLPRGGGPDGQSPVYVKKGQEVNYTVYVMHRRKDIWGEDAEEFRPDRWQGKRTGWEYLPFNGGPRVCLGQQFSLTETAYVIVRLMQKFAEGQNLDTSPGAPLHALNLTTSPNGCWLRFKEEA